MNRLIQYIKPCQLDLTRSSHCTIAALIGVGLLLTAIKHMIYVQSVPWYIWIIVVVYHQTVIHAKMPKNWS